MTLQQRLNHAVAFPHGIGNEASEAIAGGEMQILFFTTPFPKSFVR